MTDAAMSEPPLGAPVPGWTPPPRPPRAPLEGTHVRLEPLDPDRHAEEIHAADMTDPDGRIWTYLPYGPFASADALAAWMRADCMGDDPQFYALRDLETGRAAGMCSYLRIAPAAGSIEVGHIRFSPLLKRSRAATEAMALMMGWAFDAGYRRYEWKCDALNAPSCRAARRLGFLYEGIFRQATVSKGRNRDTAWYAILDSEWPALKGAFDAWLAPGNFDDAGRQRSALSDLTAEALAPLRLGVPSPFPEPWR